jgi:hypothetical protein
MPEPYDITWAAEDILVIRRRGFMTLDQANKYFLEAKHAMDEAPSHWGLVVDTSEAVAQKEDVSAVLQEQMNYTATAGASRVAIVTGRVVGTMQVKRLNAGAGWAPDVLSFHDSYDAALADVKQALTSD